MRLHTISKSVVDRVLYDPQVDEHNCSKVAQYIQESHKRQTYSLLQMSSYGYGNVNVFENV